LTLAAASQNAAITRIDAATEDTRSRVRGADPNVDSLQRLGMNDADLLAAVTRQAV
jgi:hypothetical protein